VDLLDAVPMEDRDTKSDVYEYMLGKIATAGQNGQFRTPRHIIRLMACGTAGFLVTAGEYLRERHPNILHDAKLREHFHHRMFHGFRFRLHHAAHRQHEHAAARRGEPRHPLPRLAGAEPRRRGGRSTRWCWPIRPSQAASTNENTAKDLLQIVKTKKTELLFLALFLFTKTNSGCTDQVWFYDVEADGWSLDDKRTPLLSEDKLGPVPRTALGVELGEFRTLGGDPNLEIVRRIDDADGLPKIDDEGQVLLEPLVEVTVSTHRFPLFPSLPMVS
jgi:hypothetical protein